MSNVANHIQPFMTAVYSSPKNKIISEGKQGSTWSAPIKVTSECITALQVMYRLMYWYCFHLISITIFLLLSLWNHSFLNFRAYKNMLTFNFNWYAELKKKTTFTEIKPAAEKFFTVRISCLYEPHFYSFLFSVNISISSPACLFCNFSDLRGSALCR